MSQHAPFSYRHPDELRADAESKNLHLPWSNSFDALRETVMVGDKTAPNRFAVLPVEGRDANPDGSPSELTFRRYRRYAEGGSGLIHFEAVSYMPEARASDRQLLLTTQTAPEIQRLLDETRQAGEASFGHTPLCYVQLQDSGRYSHASGAIPRLVQPVPDLDAIFNVPENTPMLTDADLEKTRDAYVASAVEAYKMGFDGVDLKACHRYLVSDLLGARQREGRYGGSYENRTRLIVEMAQGVRASVPDAKFQLISRFNLFDALAWPYGWGVLEKDGAPQPDLTEPKQLLKQLKELGLSFVATSCGTPYGRAWINRPYDRSMVGARPAPEHPLESLCRGIGITSEAQKALPDLPMAGFGYSWLRQYIPQVAAGIIAEGGATFVGLGRELLAYPDMPRDILQEGKVDARRICVTCSYCSEVMARGGRAGCYIRDSEKYGEFFRAYRAGSIL